ncbi:hypothetical protein CRU98_02850 [Arcobacter sp. CECT 8986]|uniref:hypothetical protein n=1 Tax=Arcobacter sp. CECT 8986 TaxID=2044507 RepID=UPI001009C0CF|nr:hypothetical protein [Arcobacter sp. CECT 8986]RXK00108.1 hypothetical protein CRU98_02850 [Arcobacter sp. CECT 8986]
MNQELAWLHNLKDEVKDFLSHQKSMIKEGYYHYSYSGDIYDEKVHWNIGSSVFALKLYYLLGIEKNQDIVNAINYIKSFQRENKIYDQFIFKKGLIRNFLGSLKNKNFTNLLNHQYISAETRQSLSALMLYNELPNNLKLNIPNSKEEIEKYLSLLNWNEPWGASSHFSHLMFFYRVAKESGQISLNEFENFTNIAIEWIDNIYHDDTGGWYKGNQINRYIVNGVMKILTGLISVDKVHIPAPEALIDTCLKATNDLDACDNFNIILVLNYASKQLQKNYRQKEIEKFALNRLQKYKAHYKKEQGGFSFFLNGANTRYYGAKITKGHNEADIHGTVLFMWGISIIIQILGLEDEFDFREFLT